MEGKSTGGTSYTGLPSGMSYMPGAVSGLDDILMNGRAYGTVASNVKSALIDYFDNISTTIKNDFEINTQFWPFVGTQAKNHINDGYPYLLFGNYIDPSNGNNIKHVVTAYAYNGNNFQVHFGWSGGYREVWINGTHGTGLGMRYKGSHIHSENVYFGSTCKSMCGCGHETASHGTHTHIHHIYDGTAGERINYDQHRIGCSDCGFSRWENHNWYNPPFSWSIYCTICYKHLYI